MIPFAPPRIDEKTVEAVAEVLRSGWITTGPRTKEFEEKLTAYCGNKRTVAVSSATAGMELALRWLDVGPGDEVIIPAYTYCATANVVMHCGAVPVMVDSRDDFNIDPEKIRAAITSRTKAIMPVDIGGLPCDYDAIHEIISDPEIQAMFSPDSRIQQELGRIMILADAAHSFGATYDGKRVGQHADISVFSFHAVKNLTTAEGGAMLLNLPDNFDHESLYKELCVKILHGQSKDALSKTRAGGWRYDVVEAGYKANMTDIQAAMGLTELPRYDDNLKRRRDICNQYNAAFEKENWSIIPVQKTKKEESSYHLYMLRISNCTEEERDRVIENIFKQGVSVNVHFQPLPLLSYYRRQGYDIDDYPNAKVNYTCEITLPVYFSLSDEQVGQVIDAVKSSVDKVLNG